METSRHRSLRHGRRATSSSLLFRASSRSRSGEIVLPRQRKRHIRKRAFLPTLSYSDDYDATTPYLCHRAPIIHSITPSVAQQGELVTIRGVNFGAVVAKASKNKVELLGKTCSVRIGALTVCTTFVSWSATAIAVHAVQWRGVPPPSDARSWSQPHLVGNHQQCLGALVLDRATRCRAAAARIAERAQPGTVDITFFAPSDTFNAVSKTRAWIPQDYTVEWAASVADFPAECGNAPNLITVAAMNDTSPTTLPLLDAVITDVALFTLGATRALRHRRD